MEHYKCIETLDNTHTIIVKNASHGTQYLKKIQVHGTNASVSKH
jgi:hypothetical protein